MSDDRAPVYDDGGTIIYRASSLGTSDHALVACRLGYDPLSWSADTLRILREGVLHEPDIITRAAGETYDVSDEQKEVELPIVPGVVVRGHIDAIFTDVGSSVVDAKSMSHDIYSKWQSKGSNAIYDYLRVAFQLSTYMLALNLPGIIITKDRNDGSITQYPYSSPPIPYAELKHRVLQLESWARKGELLSTTEHPCTDYPCRYYHLHDDPPDSIIEDALIDALCKTYILARDRKDQAERTQREVRSRILEALGTNEKVQTARYTARRSTQTRRTLDTDKLKDAVTDLDSYYVTKISEMVNVYPAKETTDGD